MHRHESLAASALPRKYSTFGEALQRLRSDRGLSHRELCARIGANQETLRQWERGETIPNARQLKKLYGTLPRLQFFESLLPQEPAPAVQEPPPASPKDPLPSQREERTLPATFGDALRRSRLAEGLDQDGLGSLLEVTGQAVSAWELNTANPILTRYEQLQGLFPALVTAPKPDAQDIEKPDGGKGAARDGSGRPATLSSPERALDPVTIGSPRNRGSATPVSTPAAAIEMTPPPSNLTRDEVDELGACYAQALMNLRRFELALQELRLKLTRAEEEVRLATEQVTRADDKLKRAVAGATAVPSEAAALEHLGPLT